MDLKTNFLNLGDYGVRYLKTGSGPVLVLLHTLGTQLDIFQKIIPALSKEFTVYTFDYPGHGYSDVPDSEYDAAFFISAVETFLEKLDLKNVTLSGISIGGSLSLILAGKQNPRVKSVIAINPYDYAKGKGIARSSLVARLIVLMSKLPLATKMDQGIHSFRMISSIYLGGVTRPDSIPPKLLKEMYMVGGRKGHTKTLMNLLHNSESWVKVKTIYKNIRIPVRIVWGEKDWSFVSERKEDSDLLPEAEIITVKNGGHFLSLDQPDAMIEQIRRPFTDILSDMERRYS